MTDRERLEQIKARWDGDVLQPLYPTEIAWLIAELEAAWEREARLLRFLDCETFEDYEQKLLNSFPALAAGAQQP